MSRLCVASLCMWVLAIVHVCVAQPVGVHLDIEPQQLSGWRSEPAKTALAHSYIDTIVAMRAQLPSKRPLTFDTQFSYSEYAITRPLVHFPLSNVTAPLLLFVLDATQHVTLMDYRNYALTCQIAFSPQYTTCSDSDSIISHGRNALNIAAALNSNATYRALAPPVTVGLGVELSPTEVPAKVTFGVMTERQLLVALDETEALFQEEYRDTFGSMAVHAVSFYNSSTFLNVSSAAAAATTQPGPLLPLRNCRGMWVWQDGYVTGRNGLSASALLDFCHAHAIDTVYLFVEGLVQEASTAPAFRAAVTLLRAGGVATAMLMGEAEWALPGADGRAAGLQLMQQASDLWDSFGNTTSPFPAPTHCRPNGQYAALYTDTTSAGSSSSSSSSSGSSAFSSSGGSSANGEPLAGAAPARTAGGAEFGPCIQAVLALCALLASAMASRL